MGSNPVCSAFTLYEAAVSNCINAALLAHESEKDKAFFDSCVEDMKQAKEGLKKAYSENKGA